MLRVKSIESCLVWSGLRDADMGDSCFWFGAAGKVMEDILERVTLIGKRDL